VTAVPAVPQRIDNRPAAEEPLADAARMMHLEPEYPPFMRHDP
jgi:hypothetical protein